jgi:ABC-type oligopeptide transport system substrate-binding subunit
MKKSIPSVFLAFVLLVVLLSGCAPASTPVPPTSIPTSTPSPIPPTSTPEPTATATTIPSPTPLPGSVVLPVDTLGKNNPWLPLDKTARPGVNYIGFNTLKPPFNSPTVRQAFAHAIDRDVLVEMAIKYKAKDPVHATTLTPPQTLGRDLYGEVGAVFDPQMAKDLLTQAGYSDPSSFPKVVFMVSASGDTAPGARFNIANAMADMWQTHLGITVEVQAIQSFGDYNNRLKSDTPDLFWMGWAADYNDPDNFLNALFHSGSGDNHGNFSNAEFDDLVESAAGSSDPAERQELYIQAERLLCETEAALIPLYHGTYNIP